MLVTYKKVVKMLDIFLLTGRFSVSKYDLLREICVNIVFVFFFIKITQNRPYFEDQI